MLSGKTIYEDIKQKEKEVDDLYKACEMVEEEFGRDNLPFKHLMEAHNTKSTELRNARNRMYTEPAKSKEKSPDLDFDF